MRRGAKRYGESSTVEYRVVGAPTAAEQSALVRDCVHDGAVGIAVTLADPDGMADALAEARAADVVINSFNSGVLDYARVGSSRHVALDETRSGEQAATLFAGWAVAPPVARASACAGRRFGPSNSPLAGNVAGLAEQVGDAGDP